MAHAFATTTERTDRYIEALAELVVKVGANVQPGQIVALASEPGKEQLARAVAEAAYKAGAKFVDLSVFDPFLKRARARYADPETLRFVPAWYGQRVLALGECRAARIALTGPVAPRIMEDVDPALAAKDMLPSMRESLAVVNQRTTNWSIVPCPTPGWAELVHPDSEPDEALARLWDEVAHVCRLDECNRGVASQGRVSCPERVGAQRGGIHLNAHGYCVPGTELAIGQRPPFQWSSGRRWWDRCG